MTGRLAQGVTLGGTGNETGKRHPTIEDNVTIYSGSTILGGETVIGSESIIAGGAFITSSVPPKTKVTVKNPELTFKGQAVSKGVWE